MSFTAETKTEIARLRDEIKSGTRILSLGGLTSAAAKAFSSASVSTISTADGRSRRAGVVPAVPVGVEIISFAVVQARRRHLPVGRNRGSRSSPLLIP